MEKRRLGDTDLEIAPLAFGGNVFGWNVGKEESLRRLRTDHIDLYLSHKPDPGTPIEETLEAHQRLIDQGKVRHAGGSNYDAEGLAEALAAGEV